MHRAAPLVRNSAITPSEQRYRQLRRPLHRAGFLGVNGIYDRAGEQLLELLVCPHLGLLKTISCSSSRHTIEERRTRQSSDRRGFQWWSGSCGPSLARDHERDQATHTESPCCRRGGGEFCDFDESSTAD